MAAAATTGLGPRRPWLSPRDARTLGWIATGAATGVAALGVAGDSLVVLGAGAAATVAALAVLAPQLMLALLLFAGALKATPWLGAVPIDLTVVTAGGVLFAMGLRALSPAGLPALPPATALAAGLAALVVMSVLWTPGEQIGMERALRFETLTMTTFVAPLVLVRSREELRRLMTGIVALAFFVAVTAVETGHASEPLVAAGSDQITLAVYSAVGLFAAVYLALVGQSLRRMLWLALPVLVFVPTILAAGSRGVLTGTIFALLALAGIVVARSRSKALSIAYIALAAVVFVLAAPGLAGQAGDKYARVLTGGSEALGVRPQLLSDGVELALAHPMGLGVGGYPAETGVVYPHNALIEVAAEQGVIGLGLFLGLVFAAASATRRGPGGALSPEAIVALTVLVLVVTASMFSETYTLNRALWFGLGLALAVPAILPGGPGSARRARSP